MFAGIGRRIAPPRFLAWLGGLLIALAAEWHGPGDPWRTFLIGFDVVTALFLLSLLPLLRDHSAARIAAHAQANAANRPLMLIVTLAVAAVVVLAVAVELGAVPAGEPTPTATAVLVIATLACAWTFANVIYALHYAHLYYSPGGAAGGYARGLDFNQPGDPDYFDFLHFALIIGMTFQTADVTNSTRAIRRASTGHSLAAFVFNIGILAFVVNLIASG